VDFAAAEPELFPDVGLWHPLAPRMYEDLKEYLNWCAEAAEAVLAPALLVLLRCVVAGGLRELLPRLGCRRPAQRWASMRAGATLVVCRISRLALTLVAWPSLTPLPRALLPPSARYDTRKDIKFAPDAPVIGLVLQRSHLVTGDHGHYDGVVAELEARGAKVVPVFAGASTSLPTPPRCCSLTLLGALHSPASVAPACLPGCAVRQREACPLSLAVAGFFLEPWTPLTHPPTHPHLLTHPPLHPPPLLRQAAWTSPRP
jgi:hypothetical protein